MAQRESIPKSWLLLTPLQTGMVHWKTLFISPKCYYSLKIQPKSNQEKYASDCLRTFRILHLKGSSFGVAPSRPIDLRFCWWKFRPPENQRKPFTNAIPSYPVGVAPSNPGFGGARKERAQTLPARTCFGTIQSGFFIWYLSAQ